MERLRDHAVAIELVKDTDNAILFAQLCKSPRVGKVTPSIVNSSSSISR